MAHTLRVIALDAGDIGLCIENKTRARLISIVLRPASP
jgi:hypothetical protein